MKYCPLCKKTYDSTWKICLYDQTLLEGADQEGAVYKPIPVDKINTAQGRFNKIGKVVVIIYGSLLLISCLFGMLWVLSNSNSMNKSSWLSTSSVIAGLVVIGCVCIYYGIKKRK